MSEPEEDARVQEIPDILNRWGHDLPPEQVHIVTVPPGLM